MICSKTQSLLERIPQYIEGSGEENSCEDLIVGCPICYRPSRHFSLGIRWGKPCTVRVAVHEARLPRACVFVLGYVFGYETANDRLQVMYVACLGRNARMMMGFHEWNPHLTLHATPKEEERRKFYIRGMFEHHIFQPPPST